MKFGKQILNRQTTEWASHYINYKALKKIINSLQSAYHNNERSLPPTPVTIGPSRIPLNADDPSQPDDYHVFLQQQKAAFFFKLERELEKVNTFYLQKENEFKVRLRSLNDKKKILLGSEKRLSARSASLVTLTEAFQQFQQDLNKLQQFIEINATGFRKILKKWDKRSRTSTKELYLTRQVEIQPCFNKDIIADLSDNVENNLLELRDRKIGLSATPISSPSPPGRRHSIGESEEHDLMDDIEIELFKAITTGAPSTVHDILERIRQHPSDEDNDIISRVFWRACSEKSSSVESIKYLVDTNKVYFKYIDDISERTCLHEAAIVGKLPLMKLCVEHGVKVDCTDIYGRKPLHYVCMSGHNAAATYLLSQGADRESCDHDGFNPLIYAVTNGHTKCVEILLDKGARIEPLEEGDHNHIPLSLACQYGHKDISLLLLDKGAKIIPDAEGLTPLHLTARQGHHGLLKVLTEHGAFLDAPDKYKGWTPIFYAASEGHIECVNVLIQAGCKVNITDEAGHSPIYYAAWEGHIKCINKLLQWPGGFAETADPIIDEPMAAAENMQIDGPIDEYLSMANNINSIPSLILPPPILPLRIYGHSYLDKKYHIQITLGHPSSKQPRPPVHLYGNSKISSLKLVMSSKPDMGIIPHSIILPLGDDREIFSFQVDTLESFSLEFDIFPTFGSKVIGKGVALPHVFDITNDHERRNNLVTGGTGGKVTCPLFDTHLKVVGELAFEFAIVKPVQGVQLEVGGQVETYWKSTDPVTLSNSSEQQLNLNEISGSIPSFITASSLSGEYIQIVVQVTRDMIAVVYSEWMLPVEEFDLCVSDVTFKQFKSLRNQQQENIDFNNITNSAELQKLIHQSYLSLEDVLKMLPSSLGVNLEIKYPTVYEMSRFCFSDILDINSYVDTILQTVYNYAQSQIINNRSGELNHKSTNRSVMFSSFNPAICSALNWKQPNYAVFFNSYCGFDSEEINSGKKRKWRGESDNETYESVEKDKCCTSLKEAVKFAKRNNLLGVICDATILVKVPSLITNVKQAGLVLTTFGIANNDDHNIILQDKYKVDAKVINGVVIYKRT
ncbi:19028_t:CDS:2 [Funneliformis geosporum]|uniref:18346_t:CDS:1 n=1 Tax=Funneliformis geosporum TaxID=1117311 RepID=A0A9W4WJA8_9GLOM|nr:18346_t:CDS:2 [Funneliformis geosporum]CAI2172861.1 19028_t:CDS:2 [Funneliformis geosporum]